MFHLILGGLAPLAFQLNPALDWMVWLLVGFVGAFAYHIGIVMVHGVEMSTLRDRNIRTYQDFDLTWWALFWYAACSIFGPMGFAIGMAILILGAFLAFSPGARRKPLVITFRNRLKRA